MLPSHSFPPGRGRRRRKYNGRRHINNSHQPHDRRLEELRQWLEQFGNLAGAELSPASADASFRRYFRVRAASASWIAMDAPPTHEDCAPFVRIAGYLEQMGLNSPRVVQADAGKGFLLLTDLGSRQYLDELRERPERADELYGDALAALLTLQEQGRRFQAELPPYDSRLLSFELSLFRDWLCQRHLGLGFSKQDDADWQTSVEMLVANALRQPKVFVHRDYHSRNLMVTGEANPGILDFQDAVEGPHTYDLASLLKDCYLSRPAAEVRGRVMDFHAALAERRLTAIEPAEFLRSFELMGVQRQLKAAGIFARLSHRDGKAGYLDDIPRTLKYISEIAPRYAELEFVGQLIGERCLPLLRPAAPAEGRAHQ